MENLRFSVVVFAGLNSGGIAIIVLGCIVLVLLIAVGCLLYRKVFVSPERPSASPEGAALDE